MKCRIIFWDVYNTLIKAEQGDLDSLVRRYDELRPALEKTARNFSLSVSAESLHKNLIAGIRGDLERRRAEGVAHPEVRIEEIWMRLLAEAPAGTPLTLDYAKEVALFFERHANPKRLISQARETLVALHERGLRQGIISNAQFYTAIELTELLQGDYTTVFDPALVFYSCDLGVAKPDMTAFRRAVEVIARDGITSAECLYVGDSPVNDIAPARQVGFRALLYGPAGDIQQLPQLLEHL